MQHIELDKSIHALCLVWSYLCCCNLIWQDGELSSSPCTPEAEHLLMLIVFLYTFLSLNCKCEGLLSSEQERKLFHKKRSMTLLKIGWSDFQSASVQSDICIQWNRPHQPHHIVYKKEVNCGEWEFWAGLQSSWDACKQINQCTSYREVFQTHNMFIGVFVQFMVEFLHDGPQ